MAESAEPVGPTLAIAIDMAPDFRSPVWAWKFKWMWPVVGGIVSILFVAGLVEADYPLWRTTAVAVLLFANWLRNTIFKHLAQPGAPKQVHCTAHSTNAFLMGVAAQF